MKRFNPYHGRCVADDDLYDDMQESPSGEFVRVDDLAAFLLLVDKAIQGPEHGVMRYDRWIEICSEINEYMRELDYKPFNQWASIARPKRTA